MKGPFHARHLDVWGGKLSEDEWNVYELFLKDLRFLGQKNDELAAARKTNYGFSVLEPGPDAATNLDTFVEAKCGEKRKRCSNDGALTGAKTGAGASATPNSSTDDDTTPSATVNSRGGISSTTRNARDRSSSPDEAGWGMCCRRR